MTTMTATEYPALGCSMEDLDTPALCLDLDILESNIASVAATCRAHGVGWRPHCKGHKVPAIAQKEIRAGAIGITCAKLGEAEVMAAAGIKDLLIANLVVGKRKLQRLVELRKIADPIVCVDHIDQAKPMSAAMEKAGLKVRVIIEVDIGLQRVGVLPGDPTVEFAQQLLQLPGLELAGIMGYEGHLLTIPDVREKQTKIHAALGLLQQTRDLMVERGIPCPIVSCGGTGSYLHAVEATGITEVQAGGAVYMDAFYRNSCQVTDLGYAMTVLTTVVGRPAPDRAVIDAGRKTLNREVFNPIVAGRDDMEIVRLSAEHGELKLAPSAQDLKIGDRLQLIPGYGDLTTCLHDVFYGFRNGTLEVIWPIVGRGKVQ